LLLPVSSPQKEKQKAAKKAKKKEKEKKKNKNKKSKRKKPRFESSSDEDMGAKVADIPTSAPLFRIWVAPVGCGLFIRGLPAF
jgi:hypothetical protein